MTKRMTHSVVRGEQRFFLCHATPSDPLFAYCPPDSSSWNDETASVDADVLLVGHTHVPFIRHVADRIVVNPGSVGQPKDGGPEASYAIWEDGRFSLRKATYPVERTLEKIRRLGLPPEIARALRHLLEIGRPPTT
jgi:protein phosphatase